MKPMTAADPRHIPRRRALLALLFFGLARPAAAIAQPSTPPAHPAEPLADGSRDFDFEFGDWAMHLKRRLRPLSGSTEWVEYVGVSTVRKVWGGAANLGEIDLQGPQGRLQGLSLRLYNPQARQWNITFANIRGGEPGPAMRGGFRNGRGEFYNQEDLDGRAILVRFIFSDITPSAFAFEQAFSADGGKTWEANWIATFKRTG